MNYIEKMLKFKKWNPTKKYLKDKVIQEFREDYFLCSQGSPFLKEVESITKNPTFYGWEYGKIRIGAFDLHSLTKEQRQIWSSKKHWEKSFWAFLIQQFAKYCEHVEPVEIFWFPIDIKKSLEYAPHPFHPLVWNTGSCHRMSGEPCRIFVVRWQEAFKVLCHEVFHWLRLGSRVEMPALTNMWKQEKQWTSNGPLLLEEAWVETLASIWFPRWFKMYLGETDNEEERMRLFAHQFHQLSGLCRQWWSSTSPQKHECLLTQNPFDNDACRQWFQDTNVYSYVFWKEKVWNNPIIIQFMKQDLNEQRKQLQQESTRIGLTIQMMRLLEEPMPQDYSGRVEIRFLPQINQWIDDESKLTESDILLG